MNKEAIRIACAEACGWFNLADNPSGPLDRAYINFDKTVPDYLNDLNAMHEAEKVLTENQHTDFRRILSDVVVSKWQLSAPPYEHMANSQRRMLISATAAQRAEAFLKTMGKWQDKEGIEK